MSVTTVLPVRKQLTVPASQAKAFRIFTEGMSRWWSPDYHIGAQPFVAVVMEPGEGGRWYERAEAGQECDWGRVLVWGPPDRVVLDWQITGSWEFDAKLHTELEVRFVAESASETRVELEHRGLDSLGSQAEAIRRVFDSPGGWLGLLQGFRAALD